MDKLLAQLRPVAAVIGAQWGDEGKGKLIDILAEHFDILARAGGGANAGHTVVVDGKKRIFHLLPSGCLHEGKTIVLGSGMVLHLPTLLEEIRTLRDAGIDVLPRLKISHAAHIVLEEHRERDAKSEERLGGMAIGTTRRGIGPAYSDKAARTGTRMEALLEKAADNLPAGRHGAELKEAREVVGSCITDTVAFLHEALQQRRTILIEGAQGTLLDIDHGTYPYVTSSATTSAAALHCLGLPPQSLTSVIGVVKAYCTRVGGGPFPAEAPPDDSARLRACGNEFGATTGRPRRCGWLSIADLKRAVAINGFTHLNLTKLDVLDTEETIPVYTERGKTELPGWKTSTRGMTTFDDLPENARNYVRFIEEQAGIPVAFIGTGPGREEIIIRS